MTDEQFHKKYSTRLYSVIQACNDALKPRRHINRVSGTVLRDKENDAFKQLSGIRPATKTHLVQCKMCRDLRAALEQVWQRANLYLKDNDIPTLRSVGNHEWTQQLLDRKYKRLKKALTQKLNHLETEDKVNDIVGSYQGIYTQCFTPNARTQ